MPDIVDNSLPFRTLNKGYNSVFKPGRLSVGLVVPIESYTMSPAPTMHRHIERAQMAEALGFTAIWLRDVPFNVPSFGDAGQGFDPFVYLGFLAAQTSSIALGVSSIILPLRHPAHVAKAAASVDVLSNGRLILGIASGDRPEEYPALGISFDQRGARYRDNLQYIREVAESTPAFDSTYGRVSGGMDMLPKPVSGQLPLLVTGLSQQTPEWVAKNGDGWMTYPRPALHQADIIKSYRNAIGSNDGVDKPVMEPLYVDLEKNPDAQAKPIHLGMSLGVNALVDYLKSREAIGVNHIAINLRFNNADTEQTVESIAKHVLQEFTA